MECNLFRAHLSWQEAPQCLLFDIRLVLVRLVDVAGHSKMGTLSQKSMPGWVCLPGMLELSGKDPRKRVAGGEGGERWHRAWMDTQINNTMCRRTVSLTVGCHLLHHDAPSSIAHLLAHTHFTCKRSLNDSCWSSQSPFFFSLYTCLMNFSNSLFFFFNLFCPLLPSALMEAKGDEAPGGGDRV